MSTTIEHVFPTRRDAELAIERLVQEHGFERTDIFVTPVGRENSVGEAVNGGNAAAPLEEDRTDAPIDTAITVSIDLNNEERASIVHSVFNELEER